MSAQQITEDNHWWFASRVRAIHAVAGSHLGANLRVLDVGCGAGNMMHHLARYGTVQGVEIDPRPLALAQQRGYDVKLADAGAGIPYGSGAFDLVATLDVIEHTPDDAAVLKECARVLAPHGHLLVTAPAFMFLWSQNDVLNAHVRRYTAGTLQRAIEAAGLRVRRLTYNNFFVFPLAAMLIMSRRKSQSAPQLRSHHFDKDAYQVDMEPASPPVNAALTMVGKAEAIVLRAINLPWGTSLIALAEKKG
ncbi:MAG: class I SAM-dependent methyltransferase [Chloroflexota bacterium]